MIMEKLAAATTVGTLELRVRDMTTMLAYYTDGIGLEPLRHASGAVVLGLGNREIVTLTESTDLRPARAGEAGLFHTAVLFDDAGALARSLVSMFTKHASTYIGSADHLVSEAFYFTDPEGNGVELYHDRPRDQWQWDGNHVRMATLWLDPEEFVRKHRTEQAGAGGMLGHVHLQVGDIATAHGFYVDALGFDETARLGGQALFVSAGGYHHHMAMNVWNSAGAGPRQNTLGLGVVDILVPSADELDAVAERMRGRGVDVRDDGRTLSVLDPWRNELRLSVAR